MIKPVSPKTHALIDYALVASLLTVPALFHFNKKVKKIYTAEALLLLTYIAFTDSPVALKPLIPFPLHGKLTRLMLASLHYSRSQNLSEKIRKHCCLISDLH